MTLAARSMALLGSAALLVSLGIAAPAVAQSDAHTTCTGTPTSPGVITGTYWSDVTVKGDCAVNGGKAVVHGNLTLASGSALLAAFANNDVTGKGSSSLRVTGNIVVGDDATMLLGCLPTSFPCIDDPNQSSPTLSSHDVVGGSIIEKAPLGVIVHDTWIGGSVTQLGGGGGVNCNPTGVFALFGSPVYSTYEDSTIRGSLTMANVHTCWLGTARAAIGGNATYLNNTAADPDAIEIVSNNVHGDLICSRNSRVWDSGDLTNNLFPRIPQPNTVHGNRIGQCRLNSPTSATDQPGPGLF
jgi:hypothetical protein